MQPLRRQADRYGDSYADLAVAAAVVEMVFLMILWVLVDISDATAETLTLTAAWCLSVIGLVLVLAGAPTERRSRSGTRAARLAGVTALLVAAALTIGFVALRISGSTP
jgi:hypothetical protein